MTEVTVGIRVSKYVYYKTEARDGETPKEIFDRVYMGGDDGGEFYDSQEDDEYMDEGFVIIGDEEYYIPPT